MKRSILDIIAATLHAEGRPPEEIYCFLLGQFVGASYIWGGSSVCGTDCSGSVCACLSRALGRDIRVTADELYRSFFTRTVPNPASLDGGIGAAFFLDRTGRAVHVAGYRGAGCFVNASSIETGRKAAVRSYEELCRMYGNFTPVLRVCPLGNGKGNGVEQKLLPAAVNRRRRNNESVAV